LNGNALESSLPAIVIPFKIVDFKYPDPPAPPPIKFELIKPDDPP
jgi:hypothetical protein